MFACTDFGSGLGHAGHRHGKWRPKENAAHLSMRGAIFQSP
jgi:hypothetical protein